MSEDYIYNKHTWSSNPIKERMDPKSAFAHKAVAHLPNPNEFIQWIIKTKLSNGTDITVEPLPPWTQGPIYRHYSKDADGVGEYLEDKCADAIEEYRNNTKLFDEEHAFHLHRHHFVNNVVRKLYNEFEVVHKDNPGVPGEF